MNKNKPYDDLRTLDIGDRFNVINGAWRGYVFERNGQKMAHIEATGTDFAVTGDEKLYFEKIGRYNHEIPDGTGHMTGRKDAEDFINDFEKEFGVTGKEAEEMYAAMVEVYEKILADSHLDKDEEYLPDRY